MQPLAQDYGRLPKTSSDSDHQKERGRERADAGSLPKKEEPVEPEPSVKYDSNDHETGPIGRGKRKAYLALLFLAFHLHE